MATHLEFVLVTSLKRTNDPISNRCRQRDRIRASTFALHCDKNVGCGAGVRLIPCRHIHCPESVWRKTWNHVCFDNEMLLLSIVIVHKVQIFCKLQIFLECFDLLISHLQTVSKQFLNKTNFRIELWVLSHKNLFSSFLSSRVRPYMWFLSNRCKQLYYCIDMGHRYAAFDCKKES